MTDEREKKRVETRLALLEAEVGTLTQRITGEQRGDDNFRRSVDARLRRLEQEVGVFSARYGTVGPPGTDTPKRGS